MHIELIIPAVPVAQPRPRAVNVGKSARVHEVTSIKGSDGKRRPHPIVHFRALVAKMGAEQYTGPPIDQPIRLFIHCLFPRPSNKRWKTKPMPREPYTSQRNDWDNLGKSVCDALNGVLWVDDGLIWRAEVIREIAAGDEQPHVKVVIDTVEEEETAQDREETKALF